MWTSHLFTELKQQLPFQSDFTLLLLLASQGAAQDGNQANRSSVAPDVPCLTGMLSRNTVDGWSGTKPCQGFPRQCSGKGIKKRLDGIRGYKAPHQLDPESLPRGTTLVVGPKQEAEATGSRSQLQPDADGARGWKWTPGWDKSSFPPGLA